jgi:hypothetical protein
MFRIIFAKIFFNGILFLSLNIYAQNFTTAVSGNFQSGYKIYDNYNFSPYFDNKSINQDFTSVVRIVFDVDSKDQYSYELHTVQTYNYSNLYTGVSGRDTSMLFVDLSDNWIEKTDRTAHFYVDRANIQFAIQDLDIHLGRLAVGFGKPFFWNLFDYYDVSYLGQDYKPGIDALRVDKSINYFTGLNMVINQQTILKSSGSYLENDTTQSYQWLGSSKKMGFLLRSYTNINNVDYALLYKREPEGHRFGFEVDGEIDAFNLYNEFTYLWGSKNISMPGSYQGNLLKNHFMNIMGLGYRFSNDLKLTTEHLFNGIGDSDNLDASDIRYKNGVSTSLNNHLSGISLAYEFTPLLIGQYDIKYAWGDTSQQHGFSLVQSIHDNMDFNFGGQINIGDRPTGNNWQEPNLQSEFGRLTNLFYINLNYYF